MRERVGIGSEVTDLARHWISRAFKNVTNGLKHDATIRAGIVGIGKDCSVDLQEWQKPERSKQSDGEETASRK